MVASRSHTPTTARLGGVVAVIVVLACSCTRDDTGAAADRSTTTGPPTTTSTTVPAEEAPEPAWVVQIGTPADDGFAGVAARIDEVVAAGFTDGAVEGAANAGGRDVLVAVVGTDAAVRRLAQAGSDLDETGHAVGSAGAVTITCGSTTGSFGAPGGGLEDAWCAPVDPDGDLGRVDQRGSTDDDRLQGVAVHDGGEADGGGVAYAGGSTLGLFPSASDTSAGFLGNGDALLWQLDAEGAPRWIRQFGTSEADRAEAVATTPDGDGLIVGTTEGNLEGTSNGGADGFLARYDASGLPRWARQFGTEADDRPRGVGVGGEATRGTETYVVVGSTEGALAPALGGDRRDARTAPRLDGQEPAPSNAGATDAMVVAIDAAGDRRWAAQLGTSAPDEAAGVAIDGQTVLVAGTTSGAIDTAGRPAAGGRDGFLAALDLGSGGLRWITQFGSAGDDEVSQITVTEDGFVVVAGRTDGRMGDEPNAGGLDGFLIAFPVPVTGGSVASSL